jgi:hypothetical protein
MRTKRLKAYRSAPRKAIEPIEVSSVSSLENLARLTKKAKIVEASITGFKLMVRREDLIPKELRSNLNLDVLVGTKILVYLDLMNLEIAGTVKRARLLGKEGYELGLDYTDDAPEYWRECLLELLPFPGEISE